MSLGKKEVKIIALLALDTVFFLAEITIGYMVNSLALIADSFHMLNDILSLLVALWAVNVAKNRVADAKYTYGWQRAEILGALVNGIFLLALCFTIFVEAIQRFISPPIIDNPQLILIVGFLGLASNLVGLLLFHDGGEGHTHSHSQDHDMELGEEPESEMEEDQIEARETEDEYARNGGKWDAAPVSETTPLQDNHSSDSDIENILPQSVVNRLNQGPPQAGDHNDSAGHAHAPHRRAKKTRSLNMQGIFLHVLGDCLGNVGVILTAIFIWKTDYWWKYYFDPLVSVFITAIIFSTAMPLCKSSGRILLQGTPSSINSDEVVQEIVGINEVISVHDFHIWNLTESYFIASMHADLSCSPEQFLSVASQIKMVLHQFGIHSATIQPEFSNFYAREHMLPKRFSSTANLQGDSNGSTTENSALLSGERGSAYGTENTQGHGDTNCLVDATANCGAIDCVPKPTESHSHHH